MVKLSQNDPVYPSTHQNFQVDSKIKDVEVVLHVQEEVYQWTLAFRRRVGGTKNNALDPSLQFCLNSNQIKDKIPVIGLDIVERQV